MTDAGIPTVSVAANETVLLQRFSALPTVMFAGQTITGATPLTVTVNEHPAVWPFAAVTTYVMLLVPIAKSEPLASPAVLAVVAPGQLSAPVGAV